MLPTMAIVLALHAESASRESYTPVGMCSLTQSDADWNGRKVHLSAIYHTDGMNYGYLTGLNCSSSGVLEMVYKPDGDPERFRQKILSYCHGDEDVPCPVRVEVEIFGVIIRRAKEILVDPEHIKIGVVQDDVRGDKNGENRGQSALSGA